MSHDLSKTVSIYQLLALQNLMTDTTSILECGIAKLWTCSNNTPDFENTGLFGGLCLIKNRLYKKWEFRMYDLSTLELLFQIDITKNFVNHYRKLNEYFYYFEVQNSRIGFSFAEILDATGIYNDLYNISHFEDYDNENNKSDCNPFSKF